MTMHRVSGLRLLLPILVFLSVIHSVLADVQVERKREHGTVSHHEHGTKGSRVAHDHTKESHFVKKEPATHTEVHAIDKEHFEASGTTDINSHTKQDLDKSEAAAAGKMSKAAASGKMPKAAASGKMPKAAASGKMPKAAASTKMPIAAASGKAVPKPAPKAKNAKAPKGKMVAKKENAKAVPKGDKEAAASVKAAPKSAVSGKAAAKVPASSNKVTSKSAKSKVPASPKPKEIPCPKELNVGISVRTDVFRVDIHDKRTSVSPHLLMTPTSFSDPSYFAKDCIIGYPEPTTKKCASELNKVFLEKKRIKTLMEKAEKEGVSVNASLQRAFPGGLCITAEPLKSFVDCHCKKCSPKLAQIPDELFWIDLWSMMGQCKSSTLLRSSGQAQSDLNLCPSAVTAKKEKQAAIALDALFRKVWNTEMGKVHEEHAERVRVKMANAPARKGQKGKAPKGSPRPDKSSSTIFGVHPFVLLMQIVVTVGTVMFSFFMMYQ